MATAPLAGILVALGVRAAVRLPLDAFPDTTPVQVQVNTVAPELSPDPSEPSGFASAVAEFVASELATVP